MKLFRLMVLSLVMSVATTAFAAPVTLEQAQNAAASFVLSQQKTPRSLKMVKAAPQLTAASAQAAYYVFNIGDSQGFVIVSGDDRTNPILGYSDEGYFDADKAPANLKAWLNDYAAQITALGEMTATEATAKLAAPKAARTVDTRNSIAPMITTKWNQATPYWNKCPEFMSINENGDTIGEFAYTGCVATSMSQIMKFHNWPLKTTKEIPTYTFTYSNGDYTYSTIEMESQPVTTFDWAHMKDTYNGSEDELYTDAVATLMVYAGCAVKSQYGVSATGAYTDDIPKGFTEYFAYDPNTIQIKFRADFTLEDWENLVYQELAQGRPLIYNGTAGSSGGHSFVCDGYEYGNYYHINWGWGGMGNGYFQLAVLNPSASGIGAASSNEGYNMKQNVIIGIQPGDPSGSGDPGPTVEDALTATNLTLGFSGSLERDSKSVGFSIYKRKTFRLNYADHVGTQKRYDVGLALYDMDGNFQSMMINRGVFSTALTSASGSLEVFGSNIEARDAKKFGAGLTGTFKVVPMYMLQGTDEWKPMLESDRFYLECVIDNYTATFTVHPILNLEIVDMTFEGGEKVGSAEQVHATIRNNSSDRYFGDLYLMFGNQQLDEYSAYTTAIQAEVLPGQTSEVTFNVTPATAGTINVRIAYDANCEKLLAGSGQVTITQVQESAMNLSVDITAENATDGVIYDSHGRFKVDITNNGDGEYNKYVLAPLFIVHKDETGKVTGGDMITYGQSALNLQPGETKTLYFDFDDLAFGEFYSLNVYARNENDELKNLVASGGSVIYEIKRGMVAWDGTSMVGTGTPVSGEAIVPANALAVRLEGLNLTAVTPNANPNTLYFLGENETVPAGLENCNVVMGNVASNVALKDGYGYFTPQSFTAAAISYERTFDAARTAGTAHNWSTMVLPFAPQAIKADGDDVDYYRSADDADKAMWIGVFKQEADSVAVFDYAGELQANVPYIIAIDAKAALNGKAITWSAADALIKAEPIAYTSGEVYLMAGTFVQKSLNDIYTVDNAGALLKWSAEAQTVAPFRAFFSELNALANHADILLPGQAAAGLIGDVNCDGSINAADVTALYNYILNGNETFIATSDVNGDGAINAGDVTAVYNIILGL